MENKAKKTGRLRRTALRLLGPSISKMVVYRLLRKRISKEAAILPSGLTRSSEILFILPADRTEMIYQLENLFSILGRYRDSNLTFVCPAANSAFVSGLKNVRVFKFDPAEFQMFSEEFNKVTTQLATKSFDICVLLEKNHTLAHLYLAGMSNAHIRVGWDTESNSYPFLNIRLFSAPREGVTLWERNLEVAKILDAQTDSTVRWGVPKSTAEEVSRTLSELKIKKDSGLICVDTESLEAACGKAWCDDLIKNLRGAAPAQLYSFGGTTDGETDGENKADAAKDAPLPALPPMTIPKTAALMACTDLVITAAGQLLGLAQISACKIVPLVTEEQAALYCKTGPKVTPVTLTPDKAAGSTEISAVIKHVKALMAKPKPAAVTGGGS